MALDTHGQAFTFFGGAPAHMMDDPLKRLLTRSAQAGREGSIAVLSLANLDIGNDSCRFNHRKNPLFSLMVYNSVNWKILDANDWQSLRDVSHRSLYPARSLRSARSDWPVFGGHGCDANSQARRIKTSARPYFAGGPARACPRVYADDQRLQHGARNSVYGAGAQCQPVADAAPFTAFGQGLRERSL